MSAVVGCGGEIGWLTARPIAHRGLHDEANGVRENSLSAFRAAIAEGYAIECDVHLSADGVPVVFHDDHLERMTGRAGLLRDLDAATLCATTLLGSDDRIPSLAELFELAAGRVPLVVELKGGTTPADDRGMADALAPLVGAYRGELALMSFAPWLVDAARHVVAGTAVPVGLTAEGTRPADLAAHREVFERGCRFVSYNVHHLPNSFVTWIRDERGCPVISWTVRDAEAVRRSQAHADQMTFEGFRP